MGLMSTRDFENYFTLFNLVISLIEPPDLLIYLRASVPVLVQQIGARGREYEKLISIDYLQRLNERYEAWVETYKLNKLLIIDVDSTNFINRQEDLRKVINKIDAEIHGLF
jgi:deoxyadenosine/deoxycytidine kinase